MKSGCGAEESRLQTAERLVKFLALVTVISWRIFFLTMSARVKPDLPPDTVLTAAEMNGFDRIGAARSTRGCVGERLPTIFCRSPCSAAISPAARDPPPGNMVVWRGLARLHDITVGITIGAARRCGSLEAMPNA